MQSAAVEAALNKQLNGELYSAYLYLAMSARAERLGLPGFGHWFKSQYHEELGHADRFYTYILERDGDVTLDAIGKPDLGNNADTALGLFETSLAHEQSISDCVFNLKDLARKESDHATDVFLEWFVREQIEEEASVRTVVDQLKLVQGQPNGLFMIDRELAVRPAANVITSGLGVARE
ncbi:MAG: ferritin [Pseudomonadota bacterium]